MWNEEKLNFHLTEKIEESIHLDYKAAGSLVNTDKKKNEIAKDVSSFANSDGGTIIYGIKEHQVGPLHLPEKIDSIDRTIFTKETLEQIINSRISPRIPEVIITPVAIGPALDNRVVYVVEIPKGITAHQASDKKYYRRFNFQSIAMEDWEVKDVINRQTQSLIYIQFVPQFDPKFFDRYIKKSGVKMKFSIRAVNRGQRVIHYCDCIILGDSSSSKTILPNPPITQHETLYELLYTNEIERKITIEGEDHVVNSQRIPIGPKTFRRIGEIELLSDFFIQNLKVRIIACVDDNRITRTAHGRELLQ